MMKKIRVLIVDDSALIRQVLSAIVNAQPDMEVAATANHPVMARYLLRTVEADVMTLDVEMPLMNGMEFLEQAMDLYPQARRVLLTAYADTEVAIVGSSTSVSCERCASARAISKPRASRSGVSSA